MSRKHIYIVLIVLVVAILGVTKVKSVSALNPQNEPFFSANEIFFFDPDKCTDEDGSSDDILNICGNNLPSETKTMLDNEGIKKKTESNLERYKYAEEKTGLPWQILAVLHYNEANMASDRSITNGEPLTDHTNVDGVHISSDPKEDAVNAARIFIDNAKSVYNIDIIGNKTQENYAWAFLAYNRGGMYKCHGNRSYKDSPYVMNYFDSDHWDMKWIVGVDDTGCDGTVINGFGGEVSKRPGALAIMSYLCGEESDSQDNSSPDDTQEENSSSDGDSDITLIGDSISVTAEKQLKEKFSNSFLTMVGSRHPTSKGECNGDEGGLSILEKLVKGSGKVKTESYDSGCKDLSIDSSSLKDNIVWELGTNPNGASEDTINKIIDLIKNRNLYLVTTYDGQNKSSADSIAEMYREIASAHNNVYIVDWNKAVRDNESKYITRSDGMAVHPTEDGAKLLVDLISESVSSEGGCSNYEGKYPEHSQCGDERWNKTLYPYRPGKTYCDGGCGPSSMALIATYQTGKDILPTDIGNLTLPVGTYVNDGLLELDKIVAKKYGLELVQFYPQSNDEYIREMEKYLKDGYSLHILGASKGGYTTGVNTPFTSGHYVGIFEMTGEDTVMVADSNLPNKEYKLSDIVNSGIYGSVSAFKGTGTRHGCAGTNYCEANGGKVGPVKGSMTAEQAQKLADNYNNNVGGWKGRVAVDGNYAKGLAGSTCGTQCNCVLFSAFFTEMFTDLGFGNLWPNGGEVAGKMVNEWGFKGGTTPMPYSVFSTNGHTGVVVAVNDDGSVTTIEAGYQDDNSILAGSSAFGATVFENKNVDGYTFAYLNNNGSLHKMDGNKLNKYLQEGEISE